MRHAFDFPSKTAAAKWLVGAAAGAAAAGYVTSEYVLTDARLHQMNVSARSALSRLGLEVGEHAHAFSTPDHGLHPVHYPWDHNGAFATYDHAALRRGYQVYKDVCSACHSMSRIAWRNLIGVTHTEAEVKAMAAETTYYDGPDAEGEMHERPGKASDYFPSPYINDDAARAANAGALPPDLSCIARARHGEENYIFSLLTGYYDAPAGVTVRDGLHYNPYFPGGTIGMAQVLFDGVVDYEDGTPNTASQLARDVSTFLAWASYPEFDERKKMGMKFMIITTGLFGLSVWWKRFKWSYIKSQRLVVQPPTHIRKV